MSLVNNMLRDLDSRRAAESERTAIPNEVRPLPAMDRASLSPGLIVALVAGVAMVAGGAWWGLAKDADENLKSAAPRLETAPVATAPPPPAEHQGIAMPTQLANAAPPLPTAGAGTEEPVAATLLPAESLTPRETALPEPRKDQRAGEATPLDAKLPPRAPTRTPDARNSNRGSTPSPAAMDAPSTPNRLKLAAELKVPSAARGVEPQPRAAHVTSTAGDDDWRRAQTLLGESRQDAAEPVLKRILQVQPGHVAARQALVGVLLPAKRNAEATEVLEEGLSLQPAQTAWAMNLARLRAVANDYPAAWAVLERSLPHAEANPEYRAFCGTVLQRLNRVGEAIAHYQAALRLNPREGRWWVGIGISYESAGKSADARDAYQHAQTLGGLPPELATFVAQKLK